jgi:hypothetical protein
MVKVLRDRRGMGKQRDTPAFERTAKLRLGKQPINTKKGHSR